MTDHVDHQDPVIATPADAEHVLRRFDREARAWEATVSEDRVDEGDPGVSMIIALMLAFIVAAACLAVDIVARLPHAH